MFKISVVLGRAAHLAARWLMLVLVLGACVASAQSTVRWRSRCEHGLATSAWDMGLYTWLRFQRNCSTTAPFFEFAPDDGAGLTIAQTLCSQITDADKVGDWFCLDGVGASSAGGLTLNPVGPNFPVNRTDWQCPSGPDCAPITYMEGKSTSALAATWSGFRTDPLSPYTTPAAYTVCQMIAPAKQFLLSKTFFKGDSATTQDVSLELGIGSGTNVQFVFRYSGATSQAVAAGLDAWHLVCTTWNGTNATTYLNGVVTAGPFAATSGARSGTYVVGGTASGADSLHENVHLAGTFFTGTALTTARILGIANAVLAQKPTGTKGEPMTFARATGNKFCEKTNSDAGSVGSVVPANRPCISGGALLVDTPFSNLLTFTMASTGAWTSITAGGAAAPTQTQTYDYAPDGTKTAVRWQFPATTVGQTSMGTRASSAGAAFNGSMYLKGTSASGIVDFCVAGAPENCIVCFYAATGWSRCNVTKDGGASISSMRFGNYTAGNDGGIARSAADVLAWGPQVNVGNYPLPLLLQYDAVETGSADFAYFQLDAGVNTLPRSLAANFEYLNITTAVQPDSGIAGALVALGDTNPKLGIQTMALQPGCNANANWSPDGGYTLLSDRIACNLSDAGTTLVSQSSVGTFATTLTSPGVNWNFLSLGSRNGQAAGVVSDVRISQVCLDTVAGTCGREFVNTPGPFIEFAGVDGGGMTAPCACTLPTGGDGEPLTFTRASGAFCTKTNGILGGYSLTGIATGDLVSCGSNLPRVEYAFPNQLGLRVERAGTNVILRSQDFSNAAWSKEFANAPNLGTLTANAGPAPDGTTTAARFSCAGGAATCRMFQPVGMSSSVVGETLYVRGATDGGAPDGGVIYVSGLSLGTTACTYTPDSWTRCTNVTTIAGPLNYLMVGCEAGLYGMPAACPTIDAYIWGAQMELGTATSSYIPTTTVAVTRPVETARLSFLAGGRAFRNLSLGVTVNFRTHDGDSGWLTLDSTPDAFNGVLGYPTAGAASAFVASVSKAAQAGTTSGINRFSMRTDQSAASACVSGICTKGTGTVGEVFATGVSIGDYNDPSFGTRTASGIYARLCGDEGSGRCIAGDPEPFFEFAPANGAGMGTACACTQVTGSKGEPITFARTGTATCTKSGFATTGINNGDVVICPTGTPRVEATDGGVLGLLVEATRTNSVVRSQEFDNAAWVKASAGGAAIPVVTANQAIAPDGTLTADRVVYPSLTASQTTLIYTVGMPATPYRTSMYVKGNGTSGTIYTYENSGGSCTACNYNSTSWIRCGSVHNSSSYFGIGASPLESCGGPTWPGADVFMWGAQGEAGTFLTSYIPTAGVAVARGSETASFPLAPMTTGADFSWAETYVSPSNLSACAGFLTMNAGTGVQIYSCFNTGFILRVISTAFTDATALFPSFQWQSGVRVAAAWNRNASVLTPFTNGVAGTPSAAAPTVLSGTFATTPLENGGYGIHSLVCFNQNYLTCR